MKNLKIGTRIAIGFVAVIVVAMTLGLFANDKLGGIEKSSTEIAANSLPASEEMASTAEELSSQAEVLQSTIAYFRTGETQRARTPQSKKALQTCPAAAAPKRADSRSAAAGLSHLQQAIKGGGAAIELETNGGSTDSRDRDFTPYEA